jgi:hypothetical protein
MDKKLPTANEILGSYAKSTTEPVVETKVETPTPEPSPEVPNKVETKVEEPIQPKAEVPATEEPEEWDPEVTSTEPELKKEATFDFRSFIKDVGFDDVKDETEFKERVKKLKEPAPDAMDGLDERMKKAVELAKKGGDYLSFLKVSQVDYTKVDPIQLFEQSIKGDASYTPEEAQEILDSMTPLQKKQAGIEKRSQYVNWQRQEEARIQSEIASAESVRVAAKAKADKDLKETLNKVEKIAGLTLKPSHKQDIYDAITTGRMQKEIFFDPKTGEYDNQSMIETYFLKKNKDKIINFYTKKAKNETLRDYHKEVSNANVTPTGEKPTPEAATKSDPLMDFVNKSRGGSKK